MPYEPTPRTTKTEWQQVDLDGLTLPEAISVLQGLRSYHGDVVTLDLDAKRYDDNRNLYLGVPRPETDKEMEKRHGYERVAAKRWEDNDAAEFARLSKKFNPTGEV